MFAKVNVNEGLTVGWSKFETIWDAFLAQLFWCHARLMAGCDIDLLRWMFATHAAEWDHPDDP